MGPTDPFLLSLVLSLLLTQRKLFRAGTMAGGNGEILLRDIVSISPNLLSDLGLRFGGKPRGPIRLPLLSSSYWPHVSMEAMNMGLLTAAGG